MAFELRLLLIAVVVLAAVNLMILFQRNVVPVFIGIWLFVPKLGTNMFGVYDVPLFSFVELFCSLALLIIVVSKRQSNNYKISNNYTPRLVTSVEGGVLVFFVLMVFIQFIFSGIIYANESLHVEIPFGKFFNSFVRELSGVVFFFACYRLIKTTEQVEQCLKVFVCVSMVVVAEFVAVTWFSPVTSLIGAYSFDEFSLFNSVFINDYNLVSLVGAVGALSSFYFYRKDGRWMWVIIFVLSCLLVFYNLKRSVIIAFALGAGAYFYIDYFKRWSILRRYFAVLVVAGMIAIVGSEAINFFMNKLGQSISTDYMVGRILNYDSTDSLFVRWGIQLRALEVIGEVFPMGVGSNMLRFYMGGDSPQLFVISNQFLNEGYDRVADAIVITESHSGYLEQIASYGLLGVLSLILLLIVFYRNFRHAKRKPQKEVGYYSLAISLMVLMSVYYLFVGYPRVYIILFLLLHMSFLLARKTYVE